MRIAVSSTGIDTESAVDPRFGRAQYFIIYDTEDDDYIAISNMQNMQASQGAGVQASEAVVKADVDMVISGNIGPKAYAVLSGANIKVALWSGGSVSEAIEMAKNDRLKLVDSANVEGHWT